ncbi:unnamed protein product [Amaranthus hypochondriacus]
MKLSIIPQEPTLFKGGVRSNLDPLGFYSDQDIWAALEKCQLKATISRLPNQLDSSGRVLLKRNKILVLDEATVSIDSATDAVTCPAENNQTGVLKVDTTGVWRAKLVSEYWSSSTRNAGSAEQK